MVRNAPRLCGDSGEQGRVGMASAAQAAADWPRQAEARGSLEHALALKELAEAC